MASRNFHKRRTKERKARQRAAKLALAKAYARKHRPRIDPMPMVMAGVAMQQEAALAALFRERTLHVVLTNDMDHAPKMFVRDGKRVPFDAL